MASSRLEKVGTIFSRVKGLLKSGALKEDDKPIWYDVYKAFPPKYEPRYDRPASDIPIRKIFYPEDEIRANYHKENHKTLRTINLLDQHSKTETQRFIGTYNKLKEEGKIPESDLYVAAVDVVKTERSVLRDKKMSETATDSLKISIATSFQEAQKEKELTKNVNIKDIFKE